jgi:hypothetical protein
VEGTCARCGEERGDDRWCAVCGLDSTPDAIRLRTGESLDAGAREQAWFNSHPERLEEQRARMEAWATTRERAELERLGKMRPAAFGEYRDVSWRARLARGWLIITLGLSLLTGALEIGHLNLLGDATDEDASFATLQRIDESNVTLATVYVLVFGAFIFTTVFFISWTYRAYKNGPALGAQNPRFGAGWAIGGWFVPILALWRPKQIVDDIWRMNDPADPPFVRSVDWRPRSVPFLISAWWAVFIVSGFVDRFAARGDASTIEGDRTLTSWGLVGSGLSIIGAALAIWLISTCTARQRERAAAIEALPDGAAAASDSPPTAATAPAT